MKKIIASILILSLVCSLVSCSNSQKADQPNAGSSAYESVSSGSGDSESTVETLLPSDIVPDGFDGPYFELSRTGKNVVVIMLDRAMGLYIPYILKEKPELYEKFAGFTYYKNTISFGGKTNMAVPALFGGYEYTPVEINKRADESLVDKHNEAILVMPLIFSNNGYKVTVCDPAWANYKGWSDLNIFKPYPEINAFRTRCYFGPENTESTQTCTSISTATGIRAYSLESYNVLTNLSTMTYVINEPKDTYLFLSNDTTHDPSLLQTPDYIPAEVVDNTEYDAAHADRFTVDGRTMKVETIEQMQHYHANMAAMLRISEWLDYLRENKVYDNTKIIIVSDHGGMNLRFFEDFWLDEPTGAAIDDLRSTEMYCPLLMVKEIGATEFTVSDEFMTNADVATLATNGLIKNPVNPFTGKAINSDEKYAHDQFICVSRDWEVDNHKGNRFNGAYWATVKDDIWVPDNWTLYPGWCALDEHEGPMVNKK